MTNDTPADTSGTPWKRVCFAGDCDGDGICPKCGLDYAESECPGPTMDDYEYMEDENGVLFARPVSPSPLDAKLPSRP